MTDKQEMIDGIDVSECEHQYYKKCKIDYDEWNNEIIRYNECQNSPNCHFKQLKRKEQELRDICKAFDIEYVMDKETGSLIGRCNKLNKKEQECEKYKQALDEIRDYRVCEINDVDGEEDDVILGIIDKVMEP